MLVDKIFDFETFMLIDFYASRHNPSKTAVSKT